MRIKDLARQDGTAGSGGAWRARTLKGEDATYRYVYHYDTLMLAIGPDGVEFAGIGHGSVSDQGGMNTLFKALNLPLYFSRAGGVAKIVDVPQLAFEVVGWYVPDAEVSA